MGYSGGKRTIRKSKLLTSINHGHRHSWSPRKQRTSIDAGHSHRINLKSKVALKGTTNHSHRLLNS